MEPAEARAQILDEHDRLRDRLDEIEELTTRFEKGGPDVGRALREQGVALFEVFAAHLNLEDAQLVPALRTIPERGDGLARRLEREHKEQRELLTYLLSRLEQESRPTTLVARELQGFCEYLRLDMGHEEATLLQEAILRD
jgi:hemerythrin-like domain-containing protein